MLSKKWCSILFCNNACQKTCQFDIVIVYVYSCNKDISIIKISIGIIFIMKGRAFVCDLS